MSNKSALKIWDLQMIKPVSKKHIPDFIAYSPYDKNFVCSIFSENKIKVWELSTAKEREDIKINAHWGRQPISKIPDFAKYNFRLYTPGWLIAIALDTFPEEITQSLFGCKVNNDLSITEQSLSK